MHGKTSNIELDALYQKYLPRELVLPCHTLPLLTADEARGISQRVLRERVFFPLFIRHHWIAGVLESREGKLTLKIYDSAPSAVVQDDLRKSLSVAFPGIQIKRGHSAVQKRGSNDCGLFMTAHFFAKHMGLPIMDSSTIASRLRKLCHGALVKNMDVESFLHAIKQELLKGRHVEQEDKRSTCVPMKDKEAVACTTVRGPVYQAGAVGGEQNTGSNAERVSDDPRNIEGFVGRVVDQFRQEERATSQRNLCYFSVATALAKAGEGSERSLTTNSVGMQVARKFGRGPNRQRDVGEALASLGKPLDLLIVASDGGPQLQLVERHDRIASAPLFVQGVTGMPMPATVGNHRFVLGAEFQGHIGPYGAESGHYSLTRNPADASHGVYLPASWVFYPRGGKQQPQSPPIRDRRIRSLEDNSELSREDDEDEDEQDDTDGYDALNVEASPFLNLVGSRQVGDLHVCPRSWFIHADKPPHVSQLAWNNVTPDVRRAHRRWVIDLRAMPSDLLRMDIASAGIEMVRRRAVARRWRWATVAKNLSLIAGALRDLHMYTNMERGIDLTLSREWEAATRYVRKQAKTAIAYPPSPVNHQEMLTARRELEQKCPAASLFLGLMWAFAARAGDISLLQKRDVRISSTEREDMKVGVTLIMRRGKGAKMRGPYSAASVLSREDASEVLKQMAQRRNRQTLFGNGAELREMVRLALRKQNKDSALQSVRKGAIRHLAQLGVSEEDIMRLTGHTRVETLRVYLGYGPPRTAQAVTAQEGAALVHRPLTI